GRLVSPCFVGVVPQSRRLWLAAGVTTVVPRVINAPVCGPVCATATMDTSSPHVAVPRSVLAPVDDDGVRTLATRHKPSFRVRAGARPGTMLALIGGAHAVEISFPGYVLVRRRRIVPARDIHIGEQSGGSLRTDTWEQHMDDAVKCGAERGSRRLDAAFWRESLAPYAKPDLGRSVFDVATSVVAYLALTAVMYAALDVSLLLVLVLAVPAAGSLVRTFIVFHDCAHGSFLPWRRANHWLGIACGLLVYSPFHIWRHEHAVHHASAGDLDRRGRGDVETLTVAEWVALSRPKRLAYRTFRNPLVMLGLGPIWALMIEPRLVPGSARARFGRTIIATNIALAALLAGLCALLDE
ncbi:MAG: fatty acid desaturase, partial [Actinomycetota bacterium]|nr:fatty acid desaturase [Actinomycetota bacterium]